MPLDNAAVKALARFAPDAVGLADLKPGFAISPTWDALIALGFPHMRFIEDAAMAPAAARKAAEKAIAALDPDAFPHVFPAPAVPRFLRAGAINKYHAEKWSAALDDATGFSQAEAAARIAALVDVEGVASGFRADDALYLIEALFGTAFTMNAVVDALAARDEESWMSEQGAVCDVVTASGFLLGRLPRRAHAELRKKLEKIATTPMNPFTKEAFTLMLGGMKGYGQVFSAEPDRPEGFVFATHACDPALYARLATDEDDSWGLDLWFAFWGGDAVLERWAAAIRGADAWRHQRLAIELSLLRSPVVARLMKVLLTKKRAAKVAQAWLDSPGASTKQKGNAPKPAKERSEKAVEKDFDALAAEVAVAMNAARGDRKEERRILKDAVKRYVELRTELGQPGKEAVVTFFGDDGVAFGKARKAPLLRIRSTDAEFARWVGIVESLA